jgi:hypothetical protein
MERCAEYSGYKVVISYPWVPVENQAPMGNFVCAGREYKALRKQHPTLVERLKTDLEGIPQKELSCRSVIAKTHESELFRVFTGVSEYTCDIWKERFARDMAHDASRLMDVAYIASDEGQLHLFCMLSCIGFIDMEAMVSDVSTAEVQSNTLKFICEYPSKVHSAKKTYKEVTVTNLSDLEKRETKARFVKAGKFSEIEQCQ